MKTDENQGFSFRLTQNMYYKPNKSIVVCLYVNCING